MTPDLQTEGEGEGTPACNVRSAKIGGTSLCSVPRRRGTGGVRRMIGKVIESVQLRDTCAYGVILNFQSA